MGFDTSLETFTRFWLHIKRQDNRPAHLLAQHAKNVNNYVTWMEENPSFIESALTQDVMFISLS